MSVVAFVPARCGSKSIRLKNIKDFCGRPLLFWCLNALEQAHSVDRIVLATDCREIENCAAGFEFSKTEIFRRSDANAKDKSSTEDVILEYLEKENLDNEDLFLLVQTTNPFSTASDFEQAIDQLKNTPIDSLLSCSRVKRFLWDESGKPINYQYQARPRRQDFSGSMMENGAFYLNRVGNIISSKNRLSGTIGIYEMASFTGLELDEEDDWMYGEYLMRKYVIGSGNERRIRLFLADVDGVLTDAGMYYTEKGDELKKFNTYDGMGFQLMQKQGIKVGIVTREDRELNRRRAQKLGLDYHFHGVMDKLTLVEELCTELGITMDEVAYIGDDINDKDLLEAVGTAGCPSNARNIVKRIPGIIKLKTAGGQGAVREFAEILLGTAWES